MHEIEVELVVLHLRDWLKADLAEWDRDAVCDAFTVFVGNVFSSIRTRTVNGVYYPGAAINHLSPQKNSP